ncbi:hypothetical protein [Celeribacter marinus]|uniref:hypothetical protein n=1 Tax=Celeribacter marinus TaxID=1397108 RepID=UPI003F6C5CC8
MTLVETFKSYARREDGAVTVDFVVLTATVMMLGVGVLTTVSRGSLDYAGALDEHIKAIEIGVGGTETSSGSGGGAGAGVGGGQD